MIEILTVFLGLLSGPQPVVLAVDERVAEVELRLDGQRVATLSEPPWQTRVDLGPELVPHELEAVARDGDGVELGVARRFMNREVAADPPADDPTAVVVALEPGAELPPAAGMRGWFRSGGDELTVVRTERGPADVWVVRDPAVQPYFDAMTTFFLQLHLEFNLEWGEIPLAAREAFGAAVRAALLDIDRVADSRRAEALWDHWRRSHLTLHDDVTWRLLSPRAAPASHIETPKEVFNLTDLIPSHGSGLLLHAVRIRPLDFGVRISDAVAVAGLEAHAGRRRRAVLALLADEPMGTSRYRPSEVERYLADLQVPLFVWRFSLAPEAGRRPASLPAGMDWADVRTLVYPSRLKASTMRAYLARAEAALDELEGELRRQRVVWLEGRHAPHRVTLSEAASGVRLAGSPAPPGPVHLQREEAGPGVRPDPQGE